MKKPIFAIAVIVAIVLVGFGAWYFLKSRTVGSGTPETITIAVMSDESSALILIAEDRGFFAKNGLQVSTRNCGHGVAAIKAMKSGEENISLSAEFPVVGEAFKKEKLSIIGCIDKYQPTYIVGRKDRGIVQVSDLKGKRIGVARESISEFYLGRFLDLNGMSIKDVTLADIDPSRSPLDMIVNGSIDAIVSRQIVVNSIIKGLGSNHTSWPVQSDQLTYMVMACKNDWATGHPETIKKLLKSLAESEDYFLHHPDEAKGIVQKLLNFDDSYMAGIWSQHQFSLSLDFSLIVAMTDEARWMIKNNLTSEKQVPDFANYIYTDGLKAIRPEAINIVR